MKVTLRLLRVACDTVNDTAQNGSFSQIFFRMLIIHISSLQMGGFLTESSKTIPEAICLLVKDVLCSR